MRFGTRDIPNSTLCRQKEGDCERLCPTQVNRLNLNKECPDKEKSPCCSAGGARQAGACSRCSASQPRSASPLLLSASSAHQPCLLAALLASHSAPARIWAGHGWLPACPPAGLARQQGGWEQGSLAGPPSSHSADAPWQGSQERAWSQAAWALMRQAAPRCLARCLPEGSWPFKGMAHCALEAPLWAPRHWAASGSTGLAPEPAPSQRGSEKQAAAALRWLESVLASLHLLQRA